MSVLISYDGLARVDGSARFSCNDTIALATLSGPIEVRPNHEHPSHATLDVQVRPLAHVPSTESKAQATLIQSALLPSLILTANPRSLVQLVVQSLSPVPFAGPAKRLAWTSTLACMVNASTLAFIDASSIPMKGVVCAVSVASFRNAGLVVEPSSAQFEQEEAVAGGCFAFMFGSTSSGNTASCVLSQWQSYKDGAMDEKAFFGARDQARHAARSVWTEMRASVGAKMGLTTKKDEEDESGDDAMII